MAHAMACHRCSTHWLQRMRQTEAEGTGPGAIQPNTTGHCGCTKVLVLPRCATGRTHTPEPRVADVDANPSAPEDAAIA